MENETGRKNIKIFLRHSINLKALLKKDMATFDDFIEKYKESLSDSFIVTVRSMNEFIYRKLFDESYASAASKTQVKYLNEALALLKENLKK